MKFRISILFLVLIYTSYYVFAQDTVTITSVQANLRGTPRMEGTLVSKVARGESFELIKRKGEWFLVQTPEYVGWLHKSVAVIDLTFEDITELAGIDPIKPTPKQPIPFVREYIGPNYPPTIIVRNTTDKTVTLEFIGKKYEVLENASETIAVSPGEYDFSASAPGVRPLHGIHRFERGYRYTWTFFIRE